MEPYRNGSSNGHHTNVMDPNAKGGIETSDSLLDPLSSEEAEAPNGHIEMSRSSLDQDNELFGEHAGLDNIRVSRSVVKFHSLNNYSFRISVRVYFEYLFYHIFYFCAVGPLIVLFLYPFGYKRYSNLMNNMSFTFRNEISYYWQIVNWLVILAAYFLVYNQDSTNNKGELIYSTITQTFLRISSIAGKYATFSDYQLLIMESKPLEKEDIRKELMMVYWRSQSPQVIADCTKDALLSGKIQTKVFQINFLKLPQQVTLQALESFKSSIHMTSEGKVAVPQPEDCRQANTRYFAGDTIFQFLLTKNKDLGKSMRVISLVYCLMRWLGPLIFDKMYLGKRYFFANCSTSTTLMILIQLNMFFFVFVNISFYSQAILDICRKRAVMVHLNNMVSFYSEVSEKTVLPIVNIFDITSVISWRSLYTLNQEYGKKFFIRHNIFMQVIVGLIVFDGLLLYSVGNFMGKKTPDDYLWLIILSLRVDMDLILYFILTIQLLVFSASFNESYDVPIDLLHKMVYLVDMARIYRNTYVYNQDASELRLSYTSAPSGLNYQLENDVIFERLCKQLRLRVPEERFEEHTLKLKETYELLIKSLESERDNNILRVLGARISKQVIARGAAVLVPVILALQKGLFDLLIRYHD